MADFEIKTNMAGWLDAAGEFVNRQVPFALSRALNDVAFKASGDLKADLPKRFILRGTWTAKGVQRNKATKKHLVAEVGHRQPYMAAHATGGAREARGDTQAVPSVGRGLPRKDKKSRTTKSKWPGTILSKAGAGAKLDRSSLGTFLPRGKRSSSAKKPFLMMSSKGKMIIAKRKTKKRLPLTTIYKFESEIKIKKGWPFELTTAMSVEKNWSKSAAAAMEHALANSKWSPAQEKRYRLKKFYGV
jgi:hypothetical protein